MTKLIKVKDLPNGVIVWYKNTILGIKGSTLSNEFDEFYVEKCVGNVFDYELLAKKTRQGYIKLERIEND